MPDDPELRPATVADCVAVCRLWNEIIRTTVITFTSEPRTPDGLSQLLENKALDRHPFLVASSRGRLLGFATYGQFRAGPGYAHTMESTIMIESGARGCGVGTGLMAAIENHARTQGVHSIFAGVSGENPGAVRFHAKCGFSETARLREVGFKFGRWHDLVLMQKILD
ncbi:MAG: GNAT family N-acetyltransferase [Paracoccaceae bacterium]|nr:GNAT family N-acetyltransferase [Paracoccaceae bacterium]MDE2911692.1 GNAT family N-acetyltransferase [Paracoccaceae bacterium]